MHAVQHGIAFTIGAHQWSTHPRTATALTMMDSNGNGSYLMGCYDDYAQIDSVSRDSNYVYRT